jgi:bacterioferritin (cytochrome b1)
MSELLPLDGTPKLLDALREVLALEEDLFGWSHNEEHFFKHTEYCGLVKLFDNKVTDARERRRPILDRIFQLGGMVPGVMAGPEEALRELLVKLRMLHAACQDAYEAAEDPDDYVTQKILTENQAHLERCIEKITQKLNKKAIIGEQLWLDRLV